MRSSSSVTILAAVMLGTGLASALVIIDGDRTTGTPSRNYMDPWAHLVYYYNAGTGSLLLVGPVTDPLAYAIIDLYAAGTPPDPRTGYTTPCAAPDFCAALLVALANPQQTPHTVEYVVADSCDPEPFRVPNFFQGPVFFDQRRWAFAGCPDGSAEAWIYLDGQQLAHDELDY